mgnify:CR=1 FL=1
MRVELYGIPRHLSGVEAVDIATADTLGAVLLAVGKQLPTLEGPVLDRGKLQAGYLSNLNGRQFVSDPATPLDASDVVLIVSSDMGG